MARLIYTTFASLDGCVEDADGAIDWSAPDEEVLGFLNDLERPIGTYLYGRRMYEAMRCWETMPPDPSMSSGVRDFIQLWRGAEKIVYSKTLPVVETSRTRLERDFDPESVRRLKEATGADISVGGAALAGEALKAGLVDEVRIFTVPVLIAGHKRALATDRPTTLELVESRPFSSGVVLLRYRAA